MENFCCGSTSSFACALQNLGLSTSIHLKEKSPKQSFLELFASLLGKFIFESIFYIFRQVQRRDIGNDQVIFR